MPTFLHAPLLWGLILAGVPVLIHLINLMHQRRVRWAAMEFLLISQRKNRTRVRLKELLLLLMRMLAMALVVLIVAQPLLRDELGALLGGTKTHHIILLDDSFSMSDRRDGTNALDGGKEVVDRIATMAAENVDPQRLTLLRFSHAEQIGRKTQPDFLEEQVNDDLLRRLRTTLKKIAPSHTATEPGPAIRAVEQLLGDSEDQTRIVYLVSDFRANQWDKSEPLRELLADLSAKDVSLRLINCTNSQHANLAVTDFKPISGTRAAGVSMFMEVEVRNFSPTAARNVSVIVDEEGRCQPAVKIREIPPNEAVREQFQISFATAGKHRLAARLDSDAIEIDNARYAVVDVALEVPVLIIDGSLEEQGALPLSSALAPGGIVRTGIAPRVEKPNFLNTNPLDGYQVIYLTDVEHLDAPAIDALEKYVANGGGLAIFVGPRCRSGFMNDHLWRDGKGLMPVAVTGQKELFIDRLEKVPDVEVTDHPMFQVLVGVDNSYLAMLNVTRYFGVAPDGEQKEASLVNVIARLRNGDPLVVERPFGKGRVIAWLTTASSIWNNAESNPVFPVLIQEMQAYLARRDSTSTSLAVGSPIELKLAPGKYQKIARLIAPGEKDTESTTIDVTTAPNGSSGVHFARTDTAGIYGIQLTTTAGSVETHRYAVNVDTHEGNLARLDATQLSDRLDGIKYTYYQSDAFEANRQELAGYNLSDALLYLLVVLLVGEQLLALSCSYHPSRGNNSAASGQGGMS